MAAAWVFMVALLFSVGGATATVYKVGDSVGWTIQGSPNYTAWAVGKTFHVGDTLLFEYNKQYHNVEEVSKSDYGSCTTGKAIATYTTGNDSIPLKTVGHYYFLCGIPGHCLAGQKVDIPVSRGGSSAAPSTAPSTAPSSTPGGGGGSSGGSSGSGGSTGPSAAPSSNHAAVAPKGVSLAMAAVFAGLAAAIFY